MIEIERKFLPAGDDWRKEVSGSVQIRQGYLCRDPERTVRVRISGDCGYLTIKGPKIGASAPEFEYPIPAADALELMLMCEGVVEKFRHFIPLAGDPARVWEVDEFLGQNQGLVVIELELQSEDEQIAVPSWVGREVTLDGRYLNSNLSRLPYSKWINR